MHDYYRQADAEKFATLAAEMTEQSLALADSLWLEARLQLEPYYHQLKPFAVAALLYGLAALLVFLSPTKARLFFIAAITLHSGALLLRMFLMARAPVSNLHESVLFVSLLLAGCWYFLRHHKQKNLLLALIAGATAALILTGEALVAPQQDRLPVLAAVLNSNFWLGTHVLCITAGYALSILSGLLAHLCLWQGRVEHKLLTPLMLAALLLTAIGTWLGGIWADQSWGRFWGWDPKENGALLIVLWLSWLLHYRFHRSYRPRIYLSITALLTVIVALAWFGVNLLGVGLHSYGFTEAAAYGLFGFIAAEIIIITALTQRKARHG